MYTHFINMQIPVFSMALEMPFHEASMEYFCLAVRGSLGSVAGGGPSANVVLLVLLAPRLSDAASFPNWHPILTYHCINISTSHYYFKLVLSKLNSTFSLTCHRLKHHFIFIWSIASFALTKAVSISMYCYQLILEY